VAHPGKKKLGWEVRRRDLLKKKGKDTPLCECRHLGKRGGGNDTFTLPGRGGSWWPRGGQGEAIKGERETAIEDHCADKTEKREKNN